MIVRLPRGPETHSGRLYQVCGSRGRANLLGPSPCSKCGCWWSQRADFLADS